MRHDKYVKMRYDKSRYGEQWSEAQEEKPVKKSTMVFRFITPEVCVVTGLEEMVENREVCHDFKFKITVAELAINYKLLEAFRMISIYAESFQKQTRMGNPLIAACFGYTEPPTTKEYAIRFFMSYLGAFYPERPELKEDTVLSIMVTDKATQIKASEVLWPGYYTRGKVNTASFGV